MDVQFNKGEPKVALVPMAQQRELRHVQEDWTGITSAAERRKLQNRLNQRAYHKRKRESHQKSSTVAAEPPAPSAGVLIQQLPAAAAAAANLAVSQTCTMVKPEKRALARRFAQLAYDHYRSGAPCLTHLPTLVRVNAFNAVSRNAEALNISTDWLLCEAISPFNRPGPGLGQSAILPTLPACLHPTVMQLKLEHHPWVDLLPCPRLRDNILEAIEIPGLLDEDDLCHDVVEVGDGMLSASLIVWGNPWDTSGWEVSTDFIRKWGWLLYGCQDLLDATNFWRAR